MPPLQSVLLVDDDRTTNFLNKLYASVGLFLEGDFWCSGKLGHYILYCVFVYTTVPGSRSITQTTCGSFRNETRLVSLVRNAYSDGWGC
jgi:hypothetical protein